jgi:hypothetical protein
MKKLLWLVCLLISFNWIFAQGKHIGTVSNEALFYRGLKVYSDQELFFRDSGIYIESHANGKLKIVSDGTGSDDITLSGTVTGDANWVTTGTITSAGGTITGTHTLPDTVTIGEGNDVDILITFDANSKDGVLTWYEDEDYFRFDDEIMVIDDQQILLGSDSDWAIEYDEGVDDQLLFLAGNDTLTTAVTDPMFEIIVPSTPPANQQIFGIAKGTQASNTVLFTVDEDGDVNVTGKLTFSSGFWDDSPSPANNNLSAAFFWTEDFIGHVSFPASSGAGGGWTALGDATYDVLAAAGSLGGQVELTPETGSNNEVYFQLGEKGTETYVEFTASSAKKTWVEFRLAPNSIADAGNLLFGLASEGSASANFVNDDGNDIADVDFVGFSLWELDPDSVSFTYQTTGSAFVEDDSSLITTSLTSYGLYFDGDTTLSWYVGGSSAATVDIEDAGFPDGEELSPIVALKNGAADRTVSIDWIKIVSEQR